MSDRKTLESRIRSLDESIAAENEREWVVMANLGQAVHEKGVSEGDALGEARKAVDHVSSEIADLEESLRRLLEDEERREAILEERKSLNVELRNLKNKEEQTVDELGRTAWEQWKSGRQVGTEMEDALDVLIKAERRIHDVEDAVYRDKAQARKSSTLFTKGKSLFLARRKRTASAALDKLWGKAGAAVRERVPAEALSTGSVAAPMATLRALEERREAIRVRTESLAAEKQQLDEILEEMPGKGGVKKRVSWIENALETHRIVLDDAFRDLGEAWLSKPRKADPGGEISARLNERDGIVAGIEELQAEKRKLVSHLQYLNVLAKRDAAAAKAESLSADVKALQAKLKDVKKELTGLEKDLEKRRETLPELPAETGETETAES